MIIDSKENAREHDRENAPHLGHKNVIYFDIIIFFIMNNLTESDHGVIKTLCETSFAYFHHV